MDADRCPGCSSYLARIAITVDGRTILMRSCTRCARRWWTADGVPVDPGELFGRRPA